MNKYAIIVAGGVGSRMGTDLPKQFLELNGRPIIFHTLQRFVEADPTIQLVVVMHSDYFDLFNDLKQKHFNHKVELCPGGETRYHSSKNGLNQIKDDNALVAIHDAARPFISKSLINKLFETCGQLGSALPVIGAKESMRVLGQGNESNILERDLVRVVQTPQVFQLKDLNVAFSKGYKSLYTDDASVIQTELDASPELVEGEENNIKITTPLDLVMAKYILEKEF